jgi:hypothetical protein
LFVGKCWLKSGFSARKAKLGNMKTDGGYFTSVTHVHKNNWAEVDIHHISNLPVFTSLFLAYFYTQFIRWLHNMDL